MKKFAIISALLCACSTPAWAAPGLGNEVYGATVKQGEVEFETTWDSLAGGRDDGEDSLQIEVSYGVTKRLWVAAVAEFEKEPGLNRKAEEIGIEAIYHLGRVGPVDFAIYGEYGIGLNGATDMVETKLLMQHRSGPLDLRFNLIAEKKLDSTVPVELEYAASADFEVVDDISLGVQAFGELGTFHNFLPYAEHFVGPSAKVEFEGLGPEIGIRAGYLFAIGKARQDTDGQFRLALELEF